jgi:pyrroline-5-carboxylate reductase
LSAFWIVGCGAMAGAMLSRWLHSGTLAAADVTIVDPARPVVDGVRTLAALPDAPPPATLLLGIKPQMLARLAPQIADATGPATTVLSILAGTRHATLAAHFDRVARVVRVMPNLPVAIGRGAIALHAPGVDRTALDALFAPLGLVEWIDDEAQLDAVTALSGSGPAFVYRFAEAMARAGAAQGLDRAQADRLTRATVEGAAMLAAASPDTLAALADRVASKGGSTRMALDVFDADDALKHLVAAALAAAEGRNRELAAATGD